MTDWLTYKLSITLTCCEMIQRYPITIKKTQMIRILKLRKEFCLTVKVKHRQLHLLKTKFNFYWSNNLKTNNFAGKLNTKTSIQLNSRSKRNYLSNFSSSFVSNELKVITKLRNSERGRLTKDGDRNGQINGSQEEISSVHQHIIRTNEKKFNFSSWKCSITVVWG